MDARLYVLAGAAVLLLLTLRYLILSVLRVSREREVPTCSYALGDPALEILPPADSECRGELEAPATEYVMISPVEMWFGESRVGVRPDTPTCEQFQRFASELFRELEGTSHHS